MASRLGTYEVPARLVIFEQMGEPNPVCFLGKEVKILKTLFIFYTCTKSSYFLGDKKILLARETVEKFYCFEIFDFHPFLSFFPGGHVKNITSFESLGRSSITPKKSVGFRVEADLGKMYQAYSFSKVPPPGKEEPSTVITTENSDIHSSSHASLEN